MDNTPTNPQPTDDPLQSSNPAQPMPGQTIIAPQAPQPSAQQPVTPESAPSSPVPPAPAASPVSSAPSTLPDPSTFFQSAQPVQPSMAAPLGSAVVGSVFNEPPKPPKKSRKKMFVGLVAGAFLLLGGSAAGYFGYIVPNKPENVWKTSLVNMGKAYDEIVDYSLEMESAKGTDVQGKFAYAYDEESLSGDFSVKSYESDMSSVINLKQEEFSAKFEFMSVTPEGRTLPNLYLKVSELKGLETITDPSVAEAYGKFVNQWYVFDASEYEEALLEEEAPEEYTQEDYKELATAVGDVLKEYVFTADETKAVLQMDEFVAKEKRYDQNTYHYKVSVSKANLDSFEKALVEKVRDTKIGSSLTEDEVVDEYAGSLSEDLDEDETFSLWVNKKTKLMQTVRFEDEDSADNYVDIGQLYEGGDIIPLFVKASSKEDDNTTQFDLDLDLDRTQDKATLKGMLTESESGNSFQLDTTFATHNEELNLTAPADAKSIWSLLFGEYYQDDMNMETLGLSTDVDFTDPSSASELTENFRVLIERLAELPQNQQ